VEGVKFSELLALPSDGNVKRVYGEAYETADGTTVIPVARVRKGRRGRGAGAERNGHGPADAALGFAADPLGVFVVKDGQATWVPALDGNRIALIGVTTGLLAAVIGTLAVLRQPPWPRYTVTENR
jgi:uncharacterized spore protein YtfJ